VNSVSTIVEVFFLPKPRIAESFKKNLLKILSQNSTPDFPYWLTFWAKVLIPKVLPPPFFLLFLLFLLLSPSFSPSYLYPLFFRVLAPSPPSSSFYSCTKLSEPFPSSRSFFSFFQNFQAQHFSSIFGHFLNFPLLAF
jgi:hypothetical protein